jgi:hypothetical protein
MDAVLASFDWHALKDASKPKRDILYEYVKRAVRCLWEDVHARAGLVRSTRDAYGNRREPMRGDFKSPARMLPMRLYTDSSLKGDVTSERCGVPQTITQEFSASSKCRNDAVAVFKESLSVSQSNSLCTPKDEAAKGDDEGPVDETVEEEANEPSAQQQVPPLQDYCVLRVFASWPPPPVDCDESLKLSW